ncbi:MAG: BT4734/BF3469 family protein [Kiritimatiellia bacterium]
MNSTKSDNRPTNFDGITVSMVANCQRTKTSDVSFMAVLNDIQAGRWREKVEAVREAQLQHGKPAADALKKKLPAVLFSGKFSRRDNAHLLEHSGFICADLDDLNSALSRIRQRVESDPHTFACFLSPRGNGLKVLYRVPASTDNHKAAWNRVAAYIRENYSVETDPTCKEVARLCFVSFDPHLYLKHEAENIKCDTEDTAHTDNSAYPANSCHVGEKGVAPSAPRPPTTEKGAILAVSHSEKVQQIILQTQPSFGGQRNKKVLNLARGLKLDAGLSDAPKSELKKIVREWFRLALPHIKTKDFTETWADFVYAWDRVRTPLSEGAIISAWHRVESEPLPEVCEAYADNERASRLLALCWHLKRQDGTFYLSMPQAAKLLKMHPHQVLRFLKMFRADGLFSIIEKGQLEKRKATLYRWTK